jgi:hypothetical protein
VRSWSRRKWRATRRELSRDKARWDACNAQAKAQQLTGRKSWSYVYDCMKKPS